MEMNVTPAAERLQRRLLLRRLAWYQSDINRSRKKMNGRRRIVRELRFLQRAEKEICSEVPFVPFHNLLKRLSPFYARVFALAGSLGVKFRPNMLVHSRHTLDWRPFDDFVSVTAISGEMDWLLNRRLNKVILFETMGLLSFNKNSMHDSLHAIFMRLIPPPNGHRTTISYFMFMEALAIAAERLTSQQIGVILADSLSRIGTLTRSYANDPVLEIAKGDKEKVFMIDFANHLVDQYRWTDDESMRNLPEYAPFVKASHLRSTKSFTHMIAPEWLSKAIQHPYPEAWNSNNWGHSRLLLTDFSLPYLLERSTMRRLYEWYLGLFGTDTDNRDSS